METSTPLKLRENKQMDLPVSPRLTSRHFRRNQGMELRSRDHENRFRSSLSKNILRKSSSRSPKWSRSPSPENEVDFLAREMCREKELQRKSVNMINGMRVSSPKITHILRTMEKKQMNRGFKGTETSAINENNHVSVYVFISSRAFSVGGQSESKKRTSLRSFSLSSNRFRDTPNTPLKLTVPPSYPSVLFFTPRKPPPQCLT
mmetsp:Transcript_22886/g.25848  ORF Transcript_22886/g.25848 Transcript_22886/m.25848 type:complete len:204 (+) Transcript_22886:64-675(+)